MRKALLRLFHSLSLPKKYDLPLLIYCVVLSLIGVVYIGSAWITSADSVVRDVVMAVAKQLAFLAVGFIVMSFVANRYNGHKLHRSIKMIAFFVLMLLGLCLFMPATNNANAWIYLPVINASIQPSEFAKVVMILTIAYNCAGQPRQKNWKELIGWPFVIMMIYIVVIWRMQNDFGSMFAMVLISFLCFMICRHPSLSRIQWFCFWAMIIITVGLVYMQSPAGTWLAEKLPIQEYQISRITIVSDPFADFYNTGYQVGNSLIAFARGGYKGVGLGKSVQKFGYLPYAYSDFIIATIAEEGGALMLILIFFLYFAILHRLLAYARRVNRQEHKVILFGAASYLFVHLILNVGGASAFIPLTGVPLIMVSSGGTSLVTWYLVLGICEAIIAAYRRQQEDEI